MAGDAVTVERIDAWVRGFARLVEEQRDVLTDLDAAIGDADHGTNLHRGMRAVCARLGDPAESPHERLKQVGMTLVSAVGGASGPLYGTLFLRLAAACGDRSELSLADFAAAWRAGVDGLAGRGHAELGDKTMLDSLGPAADAIDAAAAASEPAAEAFAKASEAARRGRDATIPLVARKGRASYLGERSAGHQDPGATSAALLVGALAAAFAAAD